MKIGIAVDHGGYELKEKVINLLKGEQMIVQDFGAFSFNAEDDYPDFVFKLAQAVSIGEVDRGIAICGSGVGASIAANKVPNVRAALVHDTFSAHQGVEDDDMNVICLGGRVIGHLLASDIIKTFLRARFKDEQRFKRRLAKIKIYEKSVIKD